jgi:hypothetical protein
VQLWMVAGGPMVLCVEHTSANWCLAHDGSLEVDGKGLAFLA